MFVDGIGSQSMWHVAKLRMTLRHSGKTFMFALHHHVYVSFYVLRLKIYFYHGEILGK